MTVPHKVPISNYLVILCYRQHLDREYHELRLAAQTTHVAVHSAVIP